IARRELRRRNVRAGVCVTVGGPYNSRLATRRGRRRRVGSRIVVVVITASTDGDGDGGQHCQSTRHREFTPRQQVLVVHHCLLISGLVSGSVPREKALHLCHLVVLLESEPI